MISGDSSSAEHRSRDDGEGAEDSGLGAGPASGRRARGSAATVLGAAMIAVGEILEPEKTSVEIAQPADDTGPDDVMGLVDFGDLPPLD